MHGGKSIAFEHKGKLSFIHSFPHSCDMAPFYSPCRNRLSITSATVGLVTKKKTEESGLVLSFRQD